MSLAETAVADLLRRVGRGDEVAMRELYREFSRTVYAYVLNHLRDPAKAEEIVVDTMFEVWRHGERFRGESKFSTWLIGIARHKMQTVLRSAEPAHQDIEQFEEQLPAEDAGVFEILGQSQRRTGVLNCMDKLSSVQRECLHLFFYEGLSVEEVADIQECPDGTVKSRLLLARRNIKNCLQRLLTAEAG